MAVIQNLKRNWRIYTGGLLICLVASGGIYLVARHLGVSIMILTKDPYRAAGVPPYYAYISLLGSTIWLLSGAGTIITGLFAKRALGARLSDESTYRIIVIGGLTGMLMALDDILLFHDAWADRLGIPELLFQAFYLFCFLYLIGTARRLILRTPWVLFFLSLGCFGVSTIIDEFTSFSGLIDESEDIFKFDGIVFWSMYFAQVCWTYMGDWNRVTCRGEQQLERQ